MIRGRSAAWWQDRHAAARALDPILTAPTTPETDEDTTERTVAETPTGTPAPSPMVAPESADEQECVRVAGEPRQTDACLFWGAAPICAACGVLVAGDLTVLAAPEGWCIGTICGCPDQPWYTRESDWYGDEMAAWSALSTGAYTPANEEPLP